MARVVIAYVRGQPTSKQHSGLRGLPRPRWTSLARRAVSALGAGLAVLVVAGAEPARADHSYKFFHFNMCGNACHTGNDTTDDDGDPVEAIRLELTEAEVDPVAASLNEVCENQFDKLMEVLPTAWEGRFVATRTPADTPNELCRQDGEDHRKGIALLTRGSIVEGSRDVWPLPHPSEPIPERRKLLCVRVNLFRSPRFCTVHISPLSAWGDDTPDADDHAMQDEQIAEATRRANDYVEGGRPTIFMGDFNVEPISNKLDRVYDRATFGGGAVGKFKEVGQGDPNDTYDFVPPCRCGGLTATYTEDGDQLNRRIDFIFVNARDWRVEGGTVENPAHDVNGRYSDHRMVRGQVRQIH